MRKLERLRLEALEACKWRGHDMHNFVHYPNHGRRTKFSRCRKCGKHVVVNAHPFPNEIDIGGEAVALECED